MATTKQSRHKRSPKTKTKSNNTGKPPTTEAPISELPGDDEAPTDYEPIEGPRPGR